MVATELGTHTATVADLLAAAVPLVGEPATLELRWDVVWQFDCPGCGLSTPVRRPAAVIDRSEATCPVCQDERRPQIVFRLTEADHGPVRLAEAGVPAFDVVEVRGPQGSAWLELSGDRPDRAGLLPEVDIRSPEPAVDESRAGR